MVEANRRRLIVNALAGSAQTVASGLMLILLYRILLDRIGTGGLGEWSLLTALLGLARLFEFGLTGAGMKHTAEAIAKSDFGAARAYARIAILGVALISLLPVMIAIIAISYLVMLHHARFDDVLMLGIAIWIGFVLQAFRSILDAMQRADLRHFTVTLQAAIMLLACWALIPDHGWNGLLAGFLLSAAIATVMAGGLLWWLWRGIPHGPSPALGGLLGSMFTYGIPFHLTGIATQLYDPLTKSLLSGFAGLAAVGGFEMASKLVLQLRALVVGAMEAIAPHIARHSGAEHGNEVATIYRSSTRLFVVFGIPAFAAFLVATPVIASAWIGYADDVFVAMAQILSVAWTVNVLSTPAYFCALGQGRQRWNLSAHLLIAVANAGFGSLLGLAWGWVGVVTGFALALIAGSVLQMFGFHRDNGLNLGAICGRRDLPATLMACILAGAFAGAWWLLPMESRGHMQMWSLMIAPCTLLLPLADPHVRDVLRSFRGSLLGNR